MLNALVRAGWDRLVRPVGRLGARAHIHPNVITLVGVVLQGVGAWMIVDGRILAAGLIGAAAGLLDALDGAVARARGMTTKFGALLDSTTDRLSDALILVPLAWLYGVSPDIAERDETWVAALALATMVTSFLVSYVKARAEGLGLDCNVGIAERAERLILINAGLILDLIPPMLVVLGVLSLVTLAQRMAHVKRQIGRAT